MTSHFSIIQSEIQGEIQGERFLYHNIIILSFATLSTKCDNKLGNLSWARACFSYQSSHFSIAWLQSQLSWQLVYSIVSLAYFMIRLAWCSLLTNSLRISKNSFRHCFYKKVLCWNEDKFWNLMMHQNFLGDTWMMTIILFNLIYCL